MRRSGAVEPAVQTAGSASGRADRAATASVETATERLPTRPQPDQQHDPEVHRGEGGGQRAADEGAPDDDVDVVEPMTEDRNPVAIGIPTPRSGARRAKRRRDRVGPRSPSALPTVRDASGGRSPPTRTTSPPGRPGGAQRRKRTTTQAPAEQRQPRPEGNHDEGERLEGEPALHAERSSIRGDGSAQAARACQRDLHADARSRTSDSTARQRGKGSGRPGRAGGGTTIPERNYMLKATRPPGQATATLARVRPRFDVALARSPRRTPGRPPAAASPTAWRG